MLYLALTLLTAVTALPQPLPNPIDAIPTLTSVVFAKTSRRASGTKTTKVADSGGGGGGGVTRVINHTVTTGKYRSGSSNGKLAGIIIGSIIAFVLLLILAAFIYKRRKAKKAALEPKPTEGTRDEEEEVGNEKEVEVGSAPVVVGEMAYASQPAIPHGNADLIPQQPKVVDLGADGVVGPGNK